MSLMTNLFTPLFTPRLMTFEIDSFSRILAGLAIDSSEQSKFPWNPWNLSFCHVLIHEKTPFLLKEGSRYYQIWIGRELSYSYLVKCTFYSYQKLLFFHEIRCDQITSLHGIHVIHNTSTWITWNLSFRWVIFHEKNKFSDISRKSILPNMIRMVTTKIIFVEIHFLLLSENEFFMK